MHDTIAIRMELSHKSLMFFACVLYQMEKKWRGIGTSQSFEEILNNKKMGINLGLTIIQLKDEGLLGEFSEDFYKVNTLYSVSNLNTIISELIQYLLVRIDGDNYYYHLDCLNESGVNRIIELNELPKETIRKAGQRLNELLAEQESKVKN